MEPLKNKFVIQFFPINSYFLFIKKKNTSGTFYRKIEIRAKNSTNLKISCSTRLWHLENDHETLGMETNLPQRSGRSWHFFFQSVAILEIPLSHTWRVYVLTTLMFQDGGSYSNSVSVASNTGRPRDSKQRRIPEKCVM